MTKYIRKVASNGVTQYRDVTKNILVKGEDLPAAIKEELDLAGEGVIFDSEGITDDHSSVTDAEGEVIEDTANKPKTPVTEDNQPSEEDEEESIDEDSEEEAADEDSAAPAEEAPVAPVEEGRDDPLGETKEEELSDADKALADAPENNGTFTPETPRGQKTKVEKEVLTDDDKAVLDAPEMAGKFTSEPTETITVKRPKMDDGKSAAKPANALNLPEPTEKGFGFPRRNGKTGDIFNFDVPHTTVKWVDGFTVPLSEKNYVEKSDYEIHLRLVELGYVSEDGVHLV